MGYVAFLFPFSFGPISGIESSYERLTHKVVASSSSKRSLHGERFVYRLIRLAEHDPARNRQLTGALEESGPCRPSEGASCQ
jgi:hypothetical protein